MVAITACFSISVILPKPLAKKCRSNGENSWEMSMLQALEVTNALSAYPANDLDDKLERVTGHGFTKPNDALSNQPEKVKSGINLTRYE